MAYLSYSPQKEKAQEQTTKTEKCDDYPVLLKKKNNSYKPYRHEQEPPEAALTISGKPISFASARALLVVTA